MKSYFVIGKSNFPEYNITRHFETYNEARSFADGFCEELRKKFKTRIKEREYGKTFDIILRHTKITVMVYKYTHETPISMYRCA